MTDLSGLWRSSDDLGKDLILYLALLPSPVSIDSLVSLSQASVVGVLNSIEKLKAARAIIEKKGMGKGLYFFSGPDPVDFIRDHVTHEEAQRVASRITDFYRRFTENIGDKEIIKLGELYQKSGAALREELSVLKRAADILSRSGQNERAVRHYEQCLHSMSNSGVNEANAGDFLDCVLGRISVLIYHMSAKDELSLLNKAKVVASRFQKWDYLARTEMVMAQILQTQGEDRKAFRCFNNFLKLANRFGDLKVVKSAVLETCVFLFWKGRCSEVINHYEKAIGSLEEFGDDEASLKAAALVGYCFVICGRVARGMGIIETVRAKGSLLSLQQVIVFADHMMVRSLFEIRRISEAEPYVEELFSLTEDSPGDMLSRSINDQRAYILCVKGEHREAFEYHKKGVLYTQSLGWKHPCVPWVFEYLDILESKGFFDEDVNYDSETTRLVRWDDLRIKGAAFRYRATRNTERKLSLGTILSDLKKSEKYLKRSGAEVELARTRIALGRYFLKKDPKMAKPCLERAWAFLSRIDKNLFPKDLLALMPEARKFEVIVEKMIQINESLGTIRNQTSFLEKVIEVAMDFALATRGTFITLERDGKLRQVASRNLDPSLFETDRFKMVRTLVADSAINGIELVFPRQRDNGRFSFQDDSCQVHEKIFRQAGIQSFVGMPARLDNQTYGYLCLDNRLGGEPFSHNQLPLVRFLCSQIAVGLSNLDTYKEMRQLKDRFEEEAIFYKREMGLAAPIEMIGGKSEGMRKLIDRIRRSAPTDSSILILGETGVGKELVAKAIHNLSNRKHGPFIPVNLATIPQELLASELFGHAKGAFTGAHERQKGRFELAHEGTVFLDEIGDLPRAVQVKLLRVLQERTFEILGSAHQPVRSDFRVVAATNKNLRAEVEKGSFRQDLYYRLDAFTIHVPPLRERKEDIPDLARHFVVKFSKKLGRSMARIPREEMKKLIDHTWPGNVRELEHCIEQALILSDGTSIVFPDLARTSGNILPPLGQGGGVMTLENMERDYIERILTMTHWKVMGRGGAATILGKKPTTLFSRMKRLGIKRPGSSPQPPTS
jgi:transcriptional regulator with GAF, ATPase, and Fis domain